MSKKKKDKKNEIKKIHNVLDNYSFKELSSEDEKYLQTLKERLDESAQKEAVFKKTVHENKDVSEENLLKPTVIIHERIEKKTIQLPEFTEIKNEKETFEKAEIIKPEDEELIEIKKFKSSVPEFTEVKPKKIKTEEKTEIHEEEFIEIEPEEEKEHEKEETVEFTQVEPEKKEVTSKWEKVDSGEYIPEEEKKFEEVTQSAESETWEPTQEEETLKELEKEIKEEPEEKIEVFKEIKSIDQETAKTLYKHGYTTLESLKNASYKEIKKIKGIKRKTAKQIKEELTEPEPQTWEITPETEEKLDVITVDETVYCSECGCVIDQEMVFCYHCGKKIKKDKDVIEEDKKDSVKTEDNKKIEIGDTAEKEISEDEFEKIEDEIPLEEKIKPFEDIKSIDENTAVLLYNEGYNSFNSLKNIDVKELKNIKGINRKKAKKIKEEIDKKIIESAKVKPIPIGESSEGIVTKDQIKKEEDFEEEKKPLHPVELSNNKEWQPVEEDLETPEDERLEQKIEKEIKEEIETKKEEPDEWKPLEEEETLKESEIEEKNTDTEKIKIFKELKSINDETAIKLYDNGFKSVESLKNASYKEIKKIKGIKRKTAKQIKKDIEGLRAEDKIKEEQMIMEEDAEYFKDEEFFEEESKQLDTKIKEFEEKEEPKLDEELFIEEEIIEETPEKSISEEVEEEKDYNLIKLPSINKKIKNLLNENSILNIKDLEITTIKELTKIKGIRRKLAKQIKKELEEYLSNLKEKEEIDKVEENPYIKEDDFSEEDEWESFEDNSEKTKKSQKKGFIYGDYTLYKKEIITKNGKKRTIRFFSKGEPEDAEPITLPKAYEIKENKKTGVPYLRKKK